MAAITKFFILTKERWKKIQKKISSEKQLLSNNKLIRKYLLQSAAYFKNSGNSEKYGRHQIEVQYALKKFGCLGGFPGALERLRFKFTLNGKREFVPRDQVFAFIAVNYLLLQLKNK